MKKITEEQRKQWFLDKRCHVCGNNTAHSHPEWMWLANPIPELGNSSQERKELAEAEHKINQAVLKNIVGQYEEH